MHRIFTFYQCKEEIVYLWWICAVIVSDNKYLSEVNQNGIRHRREKRAGQAQQRETGQAGRTDGQARQDRGEDEEEGDGVERRDGGRRGVGGVRGG